MVITLICIEIFEIETEVWCIQSWSMIQACKIQDTNFPNRGFINPQVLRIFQVFWYLNQKLSFWCDLIHDICSAYSFFRPSNCVKIYICPRSMSFWWFKASITHNFFVLHGRILTIFVLSVFLYRSLPCLVIIL